MPENGDVTDIPCRSSLPNVRESDQTETADPVSPKHRKRRSGSDVREEFGRAKLRCWRAAEMNVVRPGFQLFRIQRRHYGQRFQQRDAERTTTSHAAGGAVGLATMFGTARLTSGIWSYRRNFLRMRRCGCGVVPHLGMNET